MLQELLNRIPKSTRVPFASLWVNCARKDEQGTKAGSIITLVHVNFKPKNLKSQIPYICDHSKLFAWQNR